MNLTTYYQFMRYILLSLLLGAGLGFTALAEDSKRIQERPLVEILEEFSETYEVLFSYDSKSLETILVHFEFSSEESLESAINRLLTPINFGYESFGQKYYVIYQRSREGKKTFKKVSRYINKIQKLEKGGELSLQTKKGVNLDQAKSIARTVQMFKREILISGTITNEAGEPMVGATVRAKGGNQGALTDEQGKYSLEIPESITALIISYIGYEPQVVEIGNQKIVDVVLAPSLNSLDEVIVVGYGTRKKSDLTGSLSSISTTDFDKQPLVRIDQAIQGRASGVTVNQTSGAPGSGYKIRIRGANSISGNNNPLYVVDGLVIGDINSVNVNDIQSLEILKDASATAIYGSRGANGVVLVTTKSGETGTSKIEFNSFWGSSQVIQELDMLSPSEFAEGVNFAEGTEVYTPAEIGALSAGGGENWHDRYFRPATFSNYQLSASGGGQKTNYYISGNFYDADGTIIDQNYKRYSLRANVGSQVTERLKVGMNIYGSREENTGARVNLATGLTWDPTTPAFTPDGDYNFTPLKPGIGNGSPNPLLQPENNVVDNFDHQIIANGYFNLDLIQGLVLNVSAGVERVDRTNNSYTSLLVNNTGNARVYNQEVSRYQNTNRLTYTHNKSENHQFQVDAVHEQQLVTTIWSEATATGFFSDNTTYKNLGLGAIQRTSNESTSESLQSYLGRVNYTLFQRFMLTASVRADGSSKFREDNRWGVFPSGSVAWRVSEEPFIQNIEAISNLKLRASYGVTGNQGIAPLATRSRPFIDAGGTNTGINYPFGGSVATIGIAPSNRLANPDLTWEKTAQTNVGFDLGLWNSKVTLSVDLFQKNTTDLLLDVILPEFVGPTVVAQNIGEVENKGIDISLGLTPVYTPDLKITTTLTVSRYVNKVIALVDGEPIEKGNSIVSGVPVNPTRVEVGQPISSFRGYVFEGVYQLGEEDAASAFGRNPGDAKYKDLNDDGIISPDDITTIGDGNPAFTWGLNSNIAYKRFDLNFLVLGSHGSDIYNLQRGRMMALGAAQFHATHGDYRNRWTTSNPSNIPSGRNGTEFLSTQFLENGSYVTLKNVSLNYTMDDVLKNVGLGAVRLFINAENLFIITDYTGFDPESTVTGNSDVDIGVDYNAYPLSRSFSAGVNLTF